jgi:Glycosyl hydrolases family 15
MRRLLAIGSSERRFRPAILRRRQQCIGHDLAEPRYRPRADRRDALASGFASGGGRQQAYIAAPACLQARLGTLRDGTGPAERFCAWPCDLSDFRRSGSESSRFRSRTVDDATVEPAQDGVFANVELAAGEEFSAILGLGDDPTAWNRLAAEEALQATLRYWSERSGRYHYQGPRRDRVIRSAVAIELLSFAPTGALAAAATASLPERIGGDRNYDYRYAWIRDASMAIATLSVLGDLESAERYLSWLSQLCSSTEMPLQVLYRVDGGTAVEEHPRDELAGYRQSRPVRFGNHSYGQRQIDCFGYLADCAVIYVARGGRWAPEYWRLLRKVADYTVRKWRQASNGLGARSAKALCQQQGYELDDVEAHS